MGNLTDHFAGGGGGSNILEYIAYQPDGRTITTVNGDITVPNITSDQSIDTTSFIDVTGSVISYTPPDGTKYVQYQWMAHSGKKDTYMLPHFYVEFDGTEVAGTKRSHYEYSQNRDTEFVTGCTIQITGSGSDDIANGKVDTWTSDKTFKVKARAYGADYGYYLNRVHYWNGTSSAQYVKPQILIVAFK